MLSQREREQFIAEMAQHDVPVAVSRKLLRYGSTLHRLAEAQCNGDWPADNGERKAVPCCRCEGNWVRSSMIKAIGKDGATVLLCKDCRTEDLVKGTLLPYPGIVPEFQGDPRGAVLRFTFADGRTTYAG